MNSLLLKGIIRDGRMELEKPIDSPDGTEVILTPPVQATALVHDAYVRLVDVDLPDLQHVRPTERIPESRPHESPFEFV